MIIYYYILLYIIIIYYYLLLYIYISHLHYYLIANLDLEPFYGHWSVTCRGTTQQVLSQSQSGERFIEVKYNLI